MKKDANELDNSRLILLIERWVKANESKRSYDQVIGELYHGKAFLVFETTTNPGPVDMNKSNEVAQLTLPYYEIEGNKYFAAFTNEELYEEWQEGNSSFRVTMPAPMLLETISKSGLGGIIINTNTTNVFVAYF